MIRISQRERDVSARATHLEAATRKFLVTTNERKQMSTKTNFKRIALVAVASLGLGVLSSVPSQATTSGTTLAVVAGTATTLKSDSTTAATVTVAGYVDAVGDTITVQVVEIARPTTATTQRARLVFLDTSSAGSSNSLARVAQGGITVTTTSVAAQDSRVVTAETPLYSIFQGTQATAGLVGGKFALMLESSTVAALPVAGTYTYTVTVKSFSSGVLVDALTKQSNVNITVATPAADSLTVNPANSTAILGVGTYTSGTTDSTVSAAATASATPAASILVTFKNANGTSPTGIGESLTVTTNIGQVGVSGGAFGRSVTVAYSSAVTIELRPDGTAGQAQINISSTSVVFTPKTVTLYGTTPTTAVATKRVNTLKIGTNPAAVTAVLKDAAGNVVGGDTTAYAFSDATTVVSDSATACTYDTANSRHTCTITGVANGTANVTISNAAQTVKSSPVAFTVSSNAAATLKMAFNKTSYAPGEKAFLSVWAVDSAGKPVAAGTYNNLLASGGISQTASFTGTTTITGADSFTSVNLTLAQKSSSSNGIESLEPVALYQVFMPVSGGTVEVKAKGGALLPVAGQVDVTATATVTDNGAAALAAVNALATTVASLKTLITTLTNLVLKIQKKVKA